jgi:hypothetical protein
MRRWLLRIFVTFIILLIVGIITVQIVLSTSVPRNLVLGQVQKALGLRISAESLSTGWWGDSSLHNVTLSLPLAGESFLNVKTLRVRHTILPAILIGRDVKLTALEFDGPELLVRQEVTGRWNVLDVLDLLRRAGGGQQAADTSKDKKSDRAEIPEIVVKDGTVRVIDQRRRTAVISPVNLQGHPDGALVWRYDVTAGPADQPQFHLLGKLAPGGEWRHEVAITMADLEPWIGPWTANFSTNFREAINRSVVNGQWRGEVVNGSVKGLLELTDFHAGPVAAKGVVNLGYADGAWSGQSSSLQISGVPGAPSAIAITSGAVVLEGSTVRTENLLATVAAGDVRIDGKYDWDQQSGDLHADWHHLIAPANFNQSGSLEAHTRNNFPGVQHVEANLTSSGSAPGYAWETTLKLDGAGKTFDAVNWDLTAQKLQLTRGKVVANLDGLTAKLEHTPKRLKLAQLSIPPGLLSAGRPRGSLHGEGYYQYAGKPGNAAGDWWLLVTGEDWHIDPNSKAKTQFSLDVSGDLHAANKGEWARIEDFYARTGTGVQTSATGSISYLATGRPIEMWVYMWYPPFSLNAYDAGVFMQGGEFRSKLHVRGGAWPLRLDVDGDLQGREVYLHGRPIGDVAMVLAGTAESPAKGDPLDYVIKLKTEKLHIFDGIWNVQAAYANVDRSTDVQIDLDTLSLEKLDGFISPPPKLRGTLAANWTMHAPHLDFSRLKIDSRVPWKIRGFAAGAVSADEINGEIHADEGNVNIDHVSIRKTTGGEINAGVSFRLKTPSQMKVGATASAWPIALPGASVLAYGQTNQPIEIDLKNRRFVGSFKLDAYPALGEMKAGVLRTEGRLDGRTIALTKIGGETLGGSINGSASYDLDDLLKARADLNIDQIDSAQLIKLFPQASGLTGSFSASAKLGPPQEARPIGPLQLMLKLDGTGAKWKTIQLGPADINAFYDRSATNREPRFVVDDSKLSLAGGEVKVFGRASKHPLGVAATQPSAWSFNVQLDGQNLDLNQLVHAGDARAADTPGRMSSQISLLGNPSDKRRIVGKGSIKLIDSDLADNTIISTLYSLLSVQLGPKVPTGRGSMTFQLEGGNMNITNFYYFNRGVEAHGTGQIADVWKAGDALVAGYVIGSIRPLKDLKLPFAADFDQILSVVQRGVTTVHVTGPVNKPKVEPALFGDMGNALRTLILGDVKGN